MERAICDSVKVAEHCRYKCYHCKKRIKKGLPVVRKGESSSRYGWLNHSFCYRCYKDTIYEFDKRVIQEFLETNRILNERFLEVEKDCQKALIAEALAEGGMQ